MTATNEPRRAVSDEERQFAINEVAAAWVRKNYERYDFKESDKLIAIMAVDIAEKAATPLLATIVDALVSHGWGPLAANDVSANQCHCPENGLIERDTCDRGHCRSCHACDCDAQADGHGWGPKPTVSLEELANYVEAVAYPDLVKNGVKGLVGYLRECGIEVTE